MPGPVSLDFTAGDFAGNLGRLHRKVAALSGAHPRLDVGRLGAAEGNPLAQPLEGIGLLAGEHQQRMALDRQIALGGNHLGGRQIATGLGLVHIGDGDGANLEALPGQGQLLGVGLVEGPGRGQCVLGREHVKVGLGGAQGQVLSGELVLGFGESGLQLALLVLNPVLPAEQGLGQLGLPAIAVIAPGNVGIEMLQGEIVPRGVARHRQGRQQQRPPLGQLLETGLAGGAGRGQGCVVGQRIAIDLLQVCRRRTGCRQARGQRQCDCQCHRSRNPSHQVLRPFIRVHQYWGMDGSTCAAHWATPPARLIRLEKP